MKYQISDIFEGHYPISQYYGVNPQNYIKYGLLGHEGIDYATPTGTKILCPFEEGIILRDNDDFKNSNYGNYIVVWDKRQKCAVWFCHLSANDVGNGHIVKRGQVLGRTGNSGNSSGPHLHFNLVETDSNGNRLNMNNGYQGFISPLDNIQWISGTPINSPTQPMNPNITKKASRFDKLALDEFGKETNTDLISDDQFNNWQKNANARRRNNGEWDKMCRALGISGDTNIVTAEILLSVAKEKFQEFNEKTVRADERAKTIVEVKQNIIRTLNEIA